MIRVCVLWSVGPVRDEDIHGSRPVKMHESVCDLTVRVVECRARS